MQELLRRIEVLNMFRNADYSVKFIDVHNAELDVQCQAQLVRSRILAHAYIALGR